VARNPGTRGRRTGDDEVHRITSAPRSHADDQHSRIVKYMVSMSVRAVCLVLAFVVPGPARWVFVAGAVLLPYVAVVLANAGREATPPPPEAPTVVPYGSLGPAPGRDPRDDPGARTS
jgi:Flp pilus assembly protein TadB